MIYFDNAATSWPKPPGVAEAMVHFLKEVGANPGRAAHRRAVDAGRIVYEAREAVCELFHAPNPLRLVWCKNVTEALNLALRGLLRPGDHVVTSSMEHNSMMRPMRALEQDGAELTVVGCSPHGVLDPADVRAAIRPNTKLVALNHASNVVGTLLRWRRSGFDWTTSMASCAGWACTARRPRIRRSAPFPMAQCVLASAVSTPRTK
jgi:cysteine desulfurase/selenocysteine lyase